MTERSELVAAVLQQVVGISRQINRTRSGPFGDRRLSKSQLDALFVLAHAAEPVTAGALAGALGVTPGAVTQLVAGLREASLVETTIGAEDARVRVIRLTDAARADVAAFEREVVAQLEPTFDGLTNAELARVATLLSQRTDAP